MANPMANDDVVDRKSRLRSELAAARAELLAAIAALGPDDWDRRTTNPEWSARDILIHLANAEPGLTARARRILAGTSELPADFDLNRWNQRQIEKRRAQGELSPETLVASLDTSRRELLALLDGLSESELDVRGWNASRREVSVADIFATAADHERTHARDIRACSSKR